MTLIVRHIVLLISAVVLFLVVLGILLWGRSEAAGHHAEFRNEFLTPSQAHLVQSQRILVAVRADLLRQSLPAERRATTLYHFQIASALENLKQQLTQIVRLAHAVDYRATFDLPTRAHRQLETAREALAALGELTPRAATRTLVLLGPLQDTLEQLERIFELERRKLDEEHMHLHKDALHIAILAAALLLIVTAPLIVRLGLGLRGAIRREMRIRNDLEEAKRNLETMAMYDSLTELGNRHLFKVRLDQAVGSARRSGRFSALMYIDLDDFKRINDSLGHDAGDEVLKVLGTRLEESVRDGDTVARIGGDEFTVIVTDMVSRENAGAIATKLLQRINAPMRIAGNDLVVSASVGITIMPTDGDDPAVLMKNADMALYRAKERGRHNFQFFVEAMDRTMVAQMTMENALRAAIREQSFTLHYQPQMDLASGKVTCVEALLRWRPADGTMVPPEEFVAVADAAGLLKEIGGWALMQACEDLVRLRGEGAPDLRLSINLSARQFREPHLVARIKRALDANGLPPSALEVEITETTLIEDIDTTISALDALRTLGITVAVDDFGIGYSSLNYLKNLPIDSLKIDRSFVRDIETDEADRSIVDAVLAMAHSLSLRIVAEGIETRWQLDYLAAQRCSSGQGFLFSRPVPAEELSVAELDETWASALAPAPPRGLHVVE